MNKTALIIVDMVYDFSNPQGRVFYPGNEAIIPNIQQLIKKARANNCLIIFMQHRYRQGKYDKNLSTMRPCCIEGSGGEHIDERLDVRDEDYVVPKRRYSGFFGTDLSLILKEHRIENTIIVGTKTNNCINATALDAHYRDYNVIVVEECVGTNDEITNRVYLDDIDKYLGDVMTLEQTLSALDKGEI